MAFRSLEVARSVAAAVNAQCSAAEAAAIERDVRTRAAASDEATRAMAGLTVSDGLKAVAIKNKAAQVAGP